MRKKLHDANDKNTKTEFGTFEFDRVFSREVPNDDELCLIKTTISGVQNEGL